MTNLVLLGCIVIVTIAAGAPLSDNEATIVKYRNTNDGSGNYEFSYVTSNGLKRYETGRLVNNGQPDEHIVVEGYYSYIDPEGKEHFIRYKADENGFQILKPVAGVAFGGPVSPAVLATLLGG